MKILFALITAALICGCATNTPLTNALAIGQRGSLQYHEVIAPPFVLATWQRTLQAGRPLHVYIEGDGMAWISRAVPSEDPTPHNPVALSLAALDTTDNVVYIARPCQFALEKNAFCQQSHWTDHRFSEEIINAMNKAVDSIVNASSCNGVELVGFSGGGAVAVLLAARRTDVRSIRTLAGNLDHDAVNRIHGVDPMPESLNPAKVAVGIRNIPQLHFSGQKDFIVPQEITRSFVEAQHSECSKQYIIDGVTHIEGWESHWPGLLEINPPCLLH